MKLGFWQVQVDDHDKYKTTFTVSFGHYEWNIIHFRLENALWKF